MRFILSARERGSGSVTLLSGCALPTRKEAIDAGAAGLSGAIVGGCDLFVIDLDDSTPVLVVGERPTVRFAPVTLPGQVGASASVEPASAWIEMTPEETDLPMEACVCPVEPEVTIEEWPFVPGDEAGGVGPSILLSDRCDDDSDRAGVWWLETGAEDVASESDETGAEDVAPLSPQGSDTTPRDETPREDMPETCASVAEEHADARLDSGVVGEFETIGDQPGDETFVAFAYRGAPVDLTAWACTDCIYVTTCPKTGSDCPASCGSFQWRPV